MDPEFVRRDEPTPLVGDPTKARATLGWEPEISFEDLIGEMVDFDVRRLA